MRMYLQVLAGYLGDWVKELRRLVGYWGREGKHFGRDSSLKRKWLWESEPGKALLRLVKPLIKSSSSPPRWVSGADFVFLSFTRALGHPI